MRPGKQPIIPSKQTSNQTKQAANFPKFTDPKNVPR
jgi:hypothetical protein